MGSLAHHRSCLPPAIVTSIFGFITAWNEFLFGLMLTTLHLPDPPTAYICANEASALGAFSGFLQRGPVHGRDAVINATDDLNVSQYFAPPIATYFLPIHEPSELLGTFILRRMEGELPEALQALIMPELIERSDELVTPKG